MVKPDQLIKRRGKLGLVGVNLDVKGVKTWVGERMGKTIEVCQGVYSRFTDRCDRSALRSALSTPLWLNLSSLTSKTRSTTCAFTHNGMQTSFSSTMRVVLTLVMWTPRLHDLKWQWMVIQTLPTLRSSSQQCKTMQIAGWSDFNRYLACNIGDLALWQRSFKTFIRSLGSSTSRTWRSTLSVGTRTVQSLLRRDVMLSCYS